MKLPFIIFICLTLSSCVTMSGAYNVVAKDPTTGVEIPGPKFVGLGKGIYSIRNAFCKQYPGAVVIISDAKTGEELKSESPYKCR